EEAHVEKREVHPRSHESAADGGKDGAEKQSFERVANRRRLPGQEWMDGYDEQDREHDSIDVVKDSPGQELNVSRCFWRIDLPVDPVPVELRESDPGHPVADDGGDVCSDQPGESPRGNAVPADPVAVGGEDVVCR